MTTELLQLDVRMLRWSDSSTAGRTATFELDPLDGIEHPLRHFPSGTKNGQRFRVIIAPIADDESSALPDVTEAIPAAPVKAPDPDKSQRGKDAYAAKDAMEKAVVRASLLCKEPGFQQWIGAGTETVAVNRLRYELDIESRSEIGRNDRAFQAFLALETRYHEATGLLPERRG
jgi:hypothetical protein